MAREHIAPQQTFCAVCVFVLSQRLTNVECKMVSRVTLSSSDGYILHRDGIGNTYRWSYLNQFDQ